MKNILKNVMIGFFSIMFYYFVDMLMICWEYNETYAIFQNAMLFVLPALPGIALAFLFIRNSIKEFFKSLGISFLTSVFVFFAYTFSGVNLILHTHLTGRKEFDLGEGLLSAVMLFSYIISCFGGTVIAAIVTLCKQRKNCLKK